VLWAKIGRYNENEMPDFAPRKVNFFFEIEIFKIHFLFDSRPIFSPDISQIDKKITLKVHQAYFCSPHSLKNCQKSPNLGSKKLKI